LKACGLFTGAIKKRNLFIGEISPMPSAYAENTRKSVRRPQAVLAVAPAQFIHQMLKMGRQMHGLGTKVLPQPFAYGIADRSARLAVDLFAVVGDWAIHDISASFSFNWMSQNQFSGMEIVSPRLRIA
jgi:hypothetical protein